VGRTCYFHAGCPDGFGAAWALWRAWGDEGRFAPRGHDDPVEAHRHAGDLVVFADISASNEDLRALADVAAQVVVLDHHASARNRFLSETGLAEELAEGGHRVHFDLDHSGAVLAWNYFHAEPAPELLRYVEDQDLWNWKLPDSEEVNAAIGSYPRDFDSWEVLALRSADELAEEGTHILRSNRAEVMRSLKGAHSIRIGSQRAEAVNSRYVRSAIGHELAKRAAFGRAWGVVYRLQGGRVDASIYSTGDLDVAEVAQSYGGGGHRNAAGFTVPLSVWVKDFL